VECGFDHRFYDRVRHLFGIGDQRAVALATIALAVGWTLALVVVMGHTLHAVTSMIPALLSAMGLSCSVHVVSEYYGAVRERQEGGPAQRVAAALEKVVLPVGLTGLATAVGFASLTLSPPRGSSACSR